MSQVDFYGNVAPALYFVHAMTGSARPTFNLDLSKVLFSSASGANKSSSFKATSDSSANSWNLTLHDGNNSFAASRVSTETGSVEAGTSLHLDVTNIGAPINSSEVTYNQLSAMLVDDSDNTVAAYGKITDSTTTGSNLAVTIPSTIPAKAYTLKVFAEDVNSSESSNLTDYASNMVDIPVTVTAATSPIPTPQTPSDPDDGNSDSDRESDIDSNIDSNSESNSDSSAVTKEEAFVNPLTWYYAANQLGSMCLIEQQGPVCVKAFNAATPKGYQEAFSFNILLRENGIFKPSHVKKSGKFVLNIPKEWQKPGRTFILIGIDKFGNTKTFSDTDLSDETFTTMLDVEGYAFSRIHMDEQAIKISETNMRKSFRVNVHIDRFEQNNYIYRNVIPLSLV